MIEVNTKLIEMLNEYPEEIQVLAKKALEKANDSSEKGLSELLENIVGEIVKKGCVQ